MDSQTADKIEELERAAAITEALRTHEDRVYSAYTRCREAAAAAATHAAQVMQLRDDLKAATKELEISAGAAQNAADLAAAACKQGEAAAEAAYIANGGKRHPRAEVEAASAVDLLHQIADKAAALAKIAQSLKDSAPN